jgi:hypothetical protein
LRFVESVLMSYYIRLIPNSPSALAGIENHTFTTQKQAVESGNHAISHPNVQRVEVLALTGLLEADDLIETITKPDDPTHQPKNKYLREIKPGVWVDVYDVLAAFGVVCPAMGHGVKKCLAPGQRGVKGSLQDKSEAIASIKRSIELEKLK